MIEERDIYQENLAQFLRLAGPLVGCDMSVEEVNRACGSREETVAYLILCGKMLDFSANVRRSIVDAARLTPRGARPSVDSVEDQGRLEASRQAAADILHQLVQDALATSPLPAQFEAARFAVAIDRFSEGLDDPTLFDRLKS